MFGYRYALRRLSFTLLKPYLMKFSLLFCLLVSAIAASFAQEIQFSEADPHPSFPGALAGDMDFADVDGDGDMDLFICGREDGWTSVPKSALFLNDGMGVFAFDSINVFPDVQFSASVFQDLDGDGDQDFLISGRGDFSEKVGQYYLNDGNGGFTLSTTLALEPCENGGFAVGDIDGDSDLDVYQYGQGGDLGQAIPFITLFRNLGNGQFEEVATPELQTFNTVQLHDIDGDGDLDLLARAIVPNAQSTDEIFKNDGNGNFSLVTSPALGELKDSYFSLGDLDGDLAADILISGSNADNEATTELYLNTGNFEFTKFSASDDLPKLFVGSNSFQDFDNDGDLDILMSGSGTGGLSGTGIVTNIIENQGNNVYVLADSLTGSYISNNAVGDINGDGKLDLVLSGTTVGTPTFKTWVYINETEVVSNVSESIQELALEIYPNPTSGRITLTTTTSEDLRLELHTATGQQAWHSRMLGQGVHELELAQPAGVYFLTVWSEGSMTTRRVQVVR